LDKPARNDRGLRWHLRYHAGATGPLGITGIDSVSEVTTGRSGHSSS
jgi:hypothetical protein